MTGRILSLIIFRLVLVSLLLIYQLLSLLLPFPKMPFQGMMVTTIILSLLSMAYLWYLRAGFREGQDPSNFIFFQFTVDILMVSYLVLITGGVESNLRFAYIIVILPSAIFLEKIAIYVITVLALSFYFLSLNIEPAFSTDLGEWDYLFENTPEIRYAMLGQFVLCFLTALLSGFMQTAYRSSRRALFLKEQSIRTLRQIRQRIAESLPSGLIICDREGRVLFMNRVGRRLLELEDTPTKDVNPWVLLDIKPFGRREEQAFKRLSRVERRIRVNDGQKIFGISYEPMEIETNKTGYLIVFQDLTRVKLLEEHKKLADRMSAIGKMAAGVAHEIRNPLASISGSIQVLKEMVPDNETAVELAQIVDRESKRLNDIISQFLAYARPGSPPEFNPVDLGECLQEFVRLTRNDVDLKNTAIELDLWPEPCIILADRAKMNQVFWNLLRNSFQASGGAGPVFMACGLENGSVFFKIKDEGIGMSEEQLKDLFTPFLSFNKSGTGLGMSIVYEIIQIHHGAIDVQSELGKGTEVKVSFPRYKG